MDFKDWLLKLEVGTGTDSVAVFSRMTMPLVRRVDPVWEEEDPFFKKKKKNANKSLS